MSILPILKYPDPILREKAVSVTIFDAGLKKIANDMAETMFDAPGVGLAAPQIGQAIQLIVVDISVDENQQDFMVMINPEITDSQGSQEDEEGCLSVIDLTANVKRKNKIRLTYQDTEGKKHEITAEGRMAVILQHEIDHLHGILFIDHLSALKRNLYKKRLKKFLASK